MGQVLAELNNKDVSKDGNNLSLTSLLLTARGKQKTSNINHETANSPMAYAANPVVLATTLWDVLAALEEAVSTLTDVQVADAAALANVSGLEAESSQYAATVAANDNAYMQGLDQNDNNYTNNMNSAQNAASTHQTEIQPSTTALNTAVQADTNQMSADGNTQASLLGTASALLQLTPGLR